MSTYFACTVSEIFTFTVYVTVSACIDLEKSFGFHNTFEITSHARFPIHIFM